MCRGEYHHTTRYTSMSIKGTARRILGGEVYQDLSFYYRNPERIHQDLVREATASLRVLPDFVIVGAMKSGTTSLYHYLASHPQVVPPQRKEVHFFDKAYRKGEDWYRRHFPLRVTMQRTSGSITGESSPYYLFHPLAPTRMHRTIPEAKLIFLLRDPVERAISHYFFMRRFGEEERDLMGAVREDAEIIEEEGAKLEKGKIYTSYKHQMFSYVERGKYYDQMKRYESLFGKSKMKVVESEKFFNKTKEVFGEICKFLGIDEDVDIDFGRKNRGDNKRPISDDTRRFLTKEFKESNEIMRKEFGVDLS